MFDALLTISLIAVAPTPGDKLTFERDVRPILKEHCFQCHGEQGVREGNLDLRLRRFLVKGGDSGASIVPGDAKGSLLIQRIADGEMPPGDDKHLSAEQLKILKTWVANKAPTARPEPEKLDATYFTQEERDWWSFQPVVKPTPPSFTEADTPIDAFLLEELRKVNGDGSRKFGFQTDADRRTLIRRISLDLLGLPPTAEQVREFLEDDQPGAWERLVDRVLASPHYGERWGRHWLDVAGYADSEGYTDEDRERPHAWRYRDYVIRAFNQDKPYDKFVTEQLAGDELVGWPHTKLRSEIIETLAATGFLRMAPDGTASGGIDQNLARNEVMAGTLQIVGGSLLGLTVHCAQCHDHRYDPIPQRDYYQLRAVFEPALNWKSWRVPAGRQVSLYSDEDKKQREAINAKAKVVDAKRQQRIDFYIEKTLGHELLMAADELREPLRKAFRTKAAERTPEQKTLLDNHPNVGRITAGSLYLYDRRRDVRAKDLDTRRKEKLDAFLKQIKEEALAKLDDAARKDVEAAFAADSKSRTDRQRELVKTHAAVDVTERTLAKFDPKAAAELKRYETAAAEIRKYRIRTELQELADEAKAIRDTIPKEYFLRILAEDAKPIPTTFVFSRGDHQQPKDKVEPRGLSVLEAPAIDRLPDLKTSGRRLQFARYLTNGRHPLVARVMVNRVWAHHFVRGLVETTGDFGYLGARPTHAKLLDWLAAEFVEANWSIKHLHRLILASRVYRQSAVGTPELVQADPQNLYLGRWPMQRLESETLRDVILFTTGQFASKMHGEPIPVMQDAVGQVVLGKENLDGERKPVASAPLGGEEFRRSVYIQVRRTRPLSVLESFDLPDLAPHCTERPTSNVATQSLMLMNSRFILSSSEAMADALIQTEKDPTAQLRRGWETAYGRPPSATQMEHAAKFLQHQTEVFAKDAKKPADAHRSALATYCQALMGSNRYLYIE